MPTRRSTSIALLVTLIWASVSAGANEDDGEPRLHPVFRFAKYQDEQLVSEYLGAADGPFARSFRQLPIAQGDMEVDCRSLTQIGFVFDPVDVGNHIYGANTKYRFEWTHSAAPESSLEYMRFHRNAPYGLIRTGVRLNDWLEDGTIRMVVRVEGETVYQTNFDLVNCPANMYRTPTPPSELLRQLEEEDSEAEDAEH